MSNYNTVIDQAGAQLQAITSGNANEIVYDEKPNQPPDALKFRFGTRRIENCVTISFDRIDGDGDNKTRRELGYIKFGHDDNFPKDVDAACVEISLTKPGVSGDAGEVTVFRMGLLKGLEVLHGGAPIVGTGTDRMTSLDGRYTTVQQGDGNFVTYDNQKAGGFGDPEAAVWSAWTGFIQR